MQKCSFLHIINITFLFNTIEELTGCFMLESTQLPRYAYCVTGHVITFQIAMMQEALKNPMP